jgi:hypothetical protein
MRIPSILPRRQVETGNSSDSEVVIRQLQAQNERLRARLLDAYDRANGLEDARDAEAGKNVAMLQIVMDLTANMGLILEPRHLDALPVGAVISTDNNQAWTHIGVDTVSGHSLWLTPTEDEAFTSEQIDAAFAIVSLAWVPGAKESN